MDTVFKALADSTRRALLDRLHQDNGQTLGELCEQLGMTRQAVTQHLALLEAANLVVVVWQGRQKLHYLNPVPLHEIYERWLHKYEHQHLEALSGLKQNLEEAARRNNPMSKPQLVYVTYIATTPQKLWDALTQGQFTKTYWYNRRIESDWQTGSPVLFYDGDSQTVTDDGEVLLAEPPYRLSYTFRYRGAPGQPESYSRVNFTLEPEGEVVKLTLIHDELPDEQAIEGWRKGWSPVLSSLKTFLETGKPLPRSRIFEEQGQVGSSE